VKNRNVKHIANITITIHGSRRGRGILVVNGSYHTHDPVEAQYMEELGLIDVDYAVAQLGEVLSAWLATAQADWRRQQSLQAGGEPTKP
jgi:hypothetical protein